MTDLALVAAQFCAALRAEGLPVGPDRAARFTRAIMLISPTRPQDLYWCALATLTSTPDDALILTRVFTTVFEERPNVAFGAPDAPNAAFGASDATNATLGAHHGTRARTVGSAAERLGARDFGELAAGELALLVEVMKRFKVVTPVRRSRRKRIAAGGRRVDLRETLRRARRSGGEPAVLRRWVVRVKPRKLVVLCDISGSMQAHARAMLQLLVCASGGARAEVFTFATRLTRLTRALAANPAKAMRQAGEQAPDWSGGTRIGAALGEFINSYGARGMARGAVVVIISDGWETGTPDLLGAEMARLSRLAYRIVWANPRTARAGFRPLTGGMAAAWPYCDAVVSAHSLDALDELLCAIGDVRPGSGSPRVRRFRVA